MSIFQFWKAIFCFAFMPLYFGGSKSQSTESKSTVTDSRSIVTNTLDGGAIGESFDFAKMMGGILGQVSNNAVSGANAATGRALDYGDSLFTTSADAVTKTASNAITQYANLSDQALSTVSDNAKNSQKGYENLFNQSLGFAENTQKNLITAYDKAASTQSAAMGQLQGAYADAKGTSDSQKQIVIGVLVVAGLLVLAPVLAKA